MPANRKPSGTLIDIVATQCKSNETARGSISLDRSSGSRKKTLPPFRFAHTLMCGLKPEEITHLKTLEGKELIQICVGQHDLQFRFHSHGTLTVLGRCELLDEIGCVADVWGTDDRSERFRFLELLSQPVINVEIDSTKSFTALFGNRCKLRVIDDSEQYESFSVDGLCV